MVAVTLDGKACSLELPPDCLSVAQATSYAKTKLGAVWVDTCTPSSHQRLPIGHLGSTKLDYCLGDTTAKTRLFLSVSGWHPGGTVAEGANVLLPGLFGSQDEPPTAEELPASLLHCGLLKLRAFTPASAQVTVDLPDRRSIVLPVAEDSQGVDVTNHVASLLGCTTTGWRVWRAAGGLLEDSDKIVPGSHYRARMDPKPGPDDQEIFVKTLTGKTITVWISLNCLVEELKLSITGKEGIPVDQQRMIYKGRQLEDTCTLASYGIGDGAVLLLVLRLRGGMFAESSGRSGDFEELGVAADEEQVAAIAAAGGVPVEVVLPDCSTVLLCCEREDDQQAILAALREHLRVSAVDAVLAADVDAMQDPAALRDMLRQAQAALRRQRQP